jgi:hypothetical protein
LRKLCLEVAPELIALLSNMDGYIFVLNFLKTSLKPYRGIPGMDKEEEVVKKKNELWIRNQAMSRFGKIIHAIHQK